MPIGGTPLPSTRTQDQREADEELLRRQALLLAEQGTKLNTEPRASPSTADIPERWYRIASITMAQQR